MLAWFVQLQRSPQQTLIDLELFRARGFTWGTILATIVSFALFGLMFTLPQFYQAVEGADALGTGMRLLPMIAGLMVGVRIGQPFLKKLGPAPLIGAGFLLAGHLADGRQQPPACTTATASWRPGSPSAASASAWPCRSP